MTPAELPCNGSSRVKSRADDNHTEPEQDARNKLLLGAATVALTAAVGIAYQRRTHDQT